MGSVWVWVEAFFSAQESFFRSIMLNICICALCVCICIHTYYTYHTITLHYSTVHYITVHYITLHHIIIHTHIRVYIYIECSIYKHPKSVRDISNISARSVVRICRYIIYYNITYNIYPSSVPLRCKNFASPRPNKKNIYIGYIGVSTAPCPASTGTRTGIESKPELDQGRGRSLGWIEIDAVNSVGWC